MLGCAGLLLVQGAHELIDALLELLGMVICFDLHLNCVGFDELLDVETYLVDPDTDRRVPTG